MKDYSKIIDMPHHVSKKHPQMSAYDRAAQFSSFAALKGYEEAVEEVGRFTDGKVELSEDKQAELDVKLGIVCGLLNGQTEITVTYFVPDEKKQGGKYVKKTGVLVKVDSYRRTLVFADGTQVPVNHITDISGDAIDRLYYGTK